MKNYEQQKIKQFLATVDTAGAMNADDREYNFQLVTSENRILRILFKRNETIGILKVNHSLFSNLNDPK